MVHLLNSLHMHTDTSGCGNLSSVMLLVCTNETSSHEYTAPLLGDGGVSASRKIAFLRCHSKHTKKGHPNALNKGFLTHGQETWAIRNSRKL